MFRETTYTDVQGKEYKAVFLTWQQVEEVLGKKHEGYPEDDEKLVEHLIAAGAPEWVKDAQGWIDEDGWGVIQLSTTLTTS